MRKEPGYKLNKKDVIIVCLFIVLVVINIIQNRTLPFGELFEQIILILLGFVGLLEIFHYVGWDIFVPEFMLYKEKKERMEDIHQCMEAYFKEEVNFLQDYSEEKIDYILTQLDINTSQLDKIRLKLIEMRCIPLANIEDAQKKIKQYLKCDEKPMVIHQEHLDSAKLTYGQVKYFVNFIDSMFLPGYCREIGSVLAYLISEKTILKSFDKIIIPYDSNFMLGLEVGKRLNRPVVKMRNEKGRVEVEKCWDGELKFTDRVIIIHDVLVTADQIMHVLDKIPSTCQVVGLYCLIVRKEWDGLKKLEDRGIKVERLMDLDDKDIIDLRKG